MLLLSPSLAVQGKGASHSFEAMIKCPRGILFMFHGCGRYAASFFYSPQGRKMVEMATEMGLGIVAFTKSEELGCWNWANDGDTVKKLAKKLYHPALARHVLVRMVQMLSILQCMPLVHQVVGASWACYHHK